MKICFDESFEKSINNLTDRKIKNKLIKLINTIEIAESLKSIPNLKKMQGFQTFYRIRIGDYRVGFELIDDDTLYFILVAHRKEIYRIFP